MSLGPSLIRVRLDQDQVEATLQGRAFFLKVPAALFGVRGIPWETKTMTLSKHKQTIKQVYTKNNGLKTTSYDQNCEGTEM